MWRKLRVCSLGGGVLMFLSLALTVFDLGPRGSSSRTAGPGSSGWQIVGPIRYQNLTIFPVVSS